MLRYIVADIVFVNVDSAFLQKTVRFPFFLRKKVMNNDQVFIYENTYVILYNGKISQILI